MMSKEDDDMAAVGSLMAGDAEPDESDPNESGQSPEMLIADLEKKLAELKARLFAE